MAGRPRNSGTGGVIGKLVIVALLLAAIAVVAILKQRGDAVSASPGREELIGRAPARDAVAEPGASAAFVLGLVFGIALGPCTFAYMAPLLAVTFKLAATDISYGVLLLLLYGVGHCSVIVVAGTSTEIVQHYLNWNEHSRGAVVLRKACGVLVVLGGLYMIYTAA